MRAEQGRPPSASTRKRCVALHRKLRVMARTFGKLLLLHRRSAQRLRTPGGARSCEAERDANTADFTDSFGECVISDEFTSFYDGQATLVCKRKVA